MNLQILEEPENSVLVKVLDSDTGNEFWTLKEKLEKLRNPIQTQVKYKNRMSRLGPKMEAVVALMLDKQYRTLADISLQSGYESLTGLSAGIRSLRKFGYTIEKRKLDDSSEYEYRIV